mgnify:FL=1
MKKKEQESVEKFSKALSKFIALNEELQGSPDTLKTVLQYLAEKLNNLVTNPTDETARAFTLSFDALKRTTIYEMLKFLDFELIVLDTEITVVFQHPIIPAHVIDFKNLVVSSLNQKEKIEPKEKPIPLPNTQQMNIEPMNPIGKADAPLLNPGFAREYTNNTTINLNLFETTKPSIFQCQCN